MDWSMGLEYVFQKKSIVGGLNRVGEITVRERKIYGTTGHYHLQAMVSLNIWPRNLVQGHGTPSAQRHYVPSVGTMAYYGKENRVVINIK